MFRFTSPHRHSIIASWHHHITTVPYRHSIAAPQHLNTFICLYELRYWHAYIQFIKHSHALILTLDARMLEHRQDIVEVDTVQ